jgi:hypothetical protein
MRKGAQGTLVTQMPVGSDYQELIIDYPDGRFLCMMRNNGQVQSDAGAPPRRLSSSRQRPYGDRPYTRLVAPPCPIFWPMQEKQDLARIDALLDEGADIEWQHKGTGRTPLLSAVIAGKADSVERLLDRGANIQHACTALGYTALGWAANAGDTEIGRADCSRCIAGCCFAGIEVHAADAGVFGRPSRDGRTVAG